MTPRDRAHLRLVHCPQGSQWVRSGLKRPGVGVVRRRPRRAGVQDHGTGTPVTVTAQTGDGTSKPLLQKAKDHPDAATRDLCQWALNYRFNRKNEVVPLHAAR